MPFTHVFDPSKGMITSRPSTGLPENASPYISGCVIKDGEIVSDYGMSNYPVPSTTKSNQLLGSVMKILEFPLTNGTIYEICFTTRHIYYFNTSSGAWDCITQGNLICNCETAWTASANVTSTINTNIKLRGTYSSKNVIADAFSTGVAAYFNFSSLDISAATNTHLTFWVYSSINLSNGTMSLRLSEQNNGGTGATYADYTIPALTANEWKQVSVPINNPDTSSAGTFPDDLNAVLSVSLNIRVDVGEYTVYLDDIRTTKEFTGTLSNRFSTSIYQDKLLYTNYTDLPGQLSSSLVATALTLSLSTGAVTNTKILLAFKDHVLYMNNIENGSTVPQRCGWTNIGSVTDVTGGTSGYQDLIDDSNPIVSAEILNSDTVLIYKTKSIVSCTWVDGHTPFRFKTVDSSVGSMFQDGVLNIDGSHVVVGSDYIYTYTLGSIPKSIDDSVNKCLYNQLNLIYKERNFIFYIPEDKEINFYLTTLSTSPTTAWVGNIQDGTWYIRPKSITTGGQLISQTTPTIGDLIGTIGEQNYTYGSSLIQAGNKINIVGDVDGKIYKLDKTTYDNTGATFIREFQTIDFVLPDTGESSKKGDVSNAVSDSYQNYTMRVSQVVIEAIGNNVTIEWSNDGGLTWNPCQGGGTNNITLSSIWKNYKLFFETIQDKIRFRFINSTLGGNFKIRYFGFEWKIRSGRD